MLYLVGMGAISHSERFLEGGVKSYGGDFPETHRLHHGDLVIATRQQSDNLPILGYPAIIPDSYKGRDVIVATNLYKVTNNSEISNRYIFWLLRGKEYRERILSCAKGTTVRMLTKESIEDFCFQCPPKKEREAIARFLDDIDERITLLRETNTLLEQIAETIFKSWFVDFDPVRAKQEGRIPEGMDEETAALFPDSFEKLELGMVPRGWKISNLGECTAYLNRGISPKYLESGGILVINQKCVRDFAVDLAKARRHDPSQRKIDGRELQAGDVLVNSTGVGTLGRVAQIVTLVQPAIVDSHVTVVRATKDIGWNYLGQFLMRKQPEIADLGEGTTGQTELSRGKLSSIKMVVPSKETLVCFDSISTPLRLRIAENFDQAQILADLRDTLLPRLISGKLRLLEAEADDDLAELFQRNRDTGRTIDLSDL